MPRSTWPRPTGGRRSIKLPTARRAEVPHLGILQKVLDLFVEATEGVVRDGIDILLRVENDVSGLNPTSRIRSTSRPLRRSAMKAGSKRPGALHQGREFGTGMRMTNPRRRRRRGCRQAGRLSDHACAPLRFHQCACEGVCREQQNRCM